jgi:hypothetical protein
MSTTSTAPIRYTPTPIEHASRPPLAISRAEHFGPQRKSRLYNMPRERVREVRYVNASMGGRMEGV